MRNLLIGLTAAASLAIASPAIAAGTGGGATIHNAATLTWEGGQTTDWVNVKVRTIGVAPLYEAEIVQANPNEEAKVVFTAISQSNGYDEYSLSFDIEENGVSAASNINFPSQINLAASVTSRNPVGNEIVIPAGSEHGFSAGDVVQLSWGGNNYRYTVDSVYVGAPAFTSGNTTTPEDPSRLALLPIDGAPTINSTNAVAGIQVGQVLEFEYKLTTGAPTEPGTPGEYDVTVKTTPSQPDENGETVKGEEEFEGIIEVLTGEAKLIKEVRNVTEGGDFTTDNISAKSGDTLEYRLTVSSIDPAGSITGAVLKDSIPEHTTYVDDSTTLNGDPVLDNNGFPFANGLAIKSENATDEGEIAAGEAAVVIFQVEVK